jgi:hypothetical protein
MNKSSHNSRRSQTKATQLREPLIIIPAKVIESFQNLSYFGEMRQRWEEIKKLQLNPVIIARYLVFLERK